jgi:hypothetical protein
VATLRAGAAAPAREAQVGLALVAPVAAESFDYHLDLIRPPRA